MYKKKRTSNQRLKRKRRTAKREDGEWMNKLSLQVICCFLILSAVRGNSLLPSGKAKEAMNCLVEYATTDYSVRQAAEAFSWGAEALLKAESAPQMTWPCKEIQTLALAADSSSRIYSFSSENDEMQVYAACGGTVQEIRDGRIVISHGNGLETVYEGCTNIYVQTLQKVRKGEMLASIVNAKEKPQLLFQILKKQQAVDIGEYLHED